MNVQLMLPLCANESACVSPLHGQHPQPATLASGRSYQPLPLAYRLSTSMPPALLASCRPTSVPSNASHSYSVLTTSCAVTNSARQLPPAGIKLLGTLLGLTVLWSASPCASAALLLASRRLHSCATSATILSSRRSTSSLSDAVSARGDGSPAPTTTIESQQKSVSAAAVAGLWLRTAHGRQRLRLRLSQEQLQIIRDTPSHEPQAVAGKGRLTALSKAAPILLRCGEATICSGWNPELAGCAPRCGDDCACQRIHTAQV